MTQNPNDLDTFEEFDDFGDDEFNGAPVTPAKQGLKEKFVDMWQNNAGFKFGVIVATVVAISAGAYAFMGSNQKPVSPAAGDSRVGSGDKVAGTVGADASPEYRDLLKTANEQRAQEALEAGKSAIPTPVGNVVGENKPKEEPIDPLAMWRKAEQEQAQPQTTPTAAPSAALEQAAPQAQAQKTDEQLNQLTQAMQGQISSLMTAWQPSEATVVSFATQNQAAPNSTSTTTTTTGGAPAATAAQKRAKVVVPAGDILYGSLITEANSDVPGPILAMVLSGPLKGGRLIGSFQVSDDYLVMRFQTLSMNGRTYSINAIALDPNTTLGGMATEVDQRYFSRLVLPAAASFISRFGDVISEPEQTTTVAGDTVVVTQKKASTKDALYAGAGDAAQQLSEFVDSEANKVRPLVRVASNTPIGIFFVSPVTDNAQEK